MTRRGRGVASAFGAALAIAYLAVMFVAGSTPERRQLVEFTARGVLTEAPEQVRTVRLTRDGTTLVFTRSGDGWARDGDAGPLTHRDAATLSRAVKFMHTSAPVRALEAGAGQGPGLAEFGLAPPRFSVALAGETGVLLQAGFGAMNTDGFLQYMQVEGDGKLYLMSRFVGAEWLAAAAAGDR